MRPLFAAVLLLFAGSGVALQAAGLQTFTIEAASLRGNPLGDPVERRVAVFSPGQAKRTDGIPILVYLPGWGGSSEDAIAEGTASWFAKVVDTLATKNARCRIAVVDARSRYGGSQYLNSTATGRYADYLTEDLMASLPGRYPAKDGKPAPLFIGGHSSGGYGALIVAASKPELFAGVVALSPDSDFDVTHRPLVQQQAVKDVDRAALEAAMARNSKHRLPGNGLAALVMGLSANYTPSVNQPGRFDWLYDDGGKWRQDVWQRWLDQDPLTIVRSRKDLWIKGPLIYLDGAEHDEFGAQIGARKIHEVLKARQATSIFYESPGGHGDRMMERLVRGILWLREVRPGVFGID